MQNVFKALVAPFNVSVFIYLDDVLCVGTPANLIAFRESVFSTNILVNIDKSVLVPTHALVYLGIRVDRRRLMVSLTSQMANRVRRGMKYASKPRPKKYWQRLAGLLNFVQTVLKWPFLVIQQAHLQDSRISCLAPMVRHLLAALRKLLSYPVYTDASLSVVSLVTHNLALSFAPYGISYI